MAQSDKDPLLEIRLMNDHEPMKLVVKGVVLNGETVELPNVTSEGLYNLAELLRQAADMLAKREGTFKKSLPFSSPDPHENH